LHAFRSLQGNPGRSSPTARRPAGPLLSSALSGALTFQQVIDEFPPPLELPPEQVQAILDTIDMNNDGRLCAKGLPESENCIDNVANNVNDG
jgi:hypothetical protein